jgi:putative tributyrin esterase
LCFNMASGFRTIEISNPLFEKDHLRYITVKSGNLKGRGDICVFVPPVVTKNIPVVILLHGVYGSAWSWALSGGVHLSAMKMMDDGLIPPMILAMPSDGLWGDGSGYLNHNGFGFEKWIAEDVPDVLKECFPEITSASSFFISGLSMGGFGALRIGVKYNQLFRCISAHSSITNLSQMKLFVEEDIEHYSQEDKTGQDCFEMILKFRDHLPAIRFDCGNKDEMVSYNRHLHHQLESSGIDHIYEEFEGGHQWTYWQEHIMKSLLFFAGHSGSEKVGKP